MDPFVYIVSSVIGAGKLKKAMAGGLEYDITVRKGEKFTGTLRDTFDDELLRKSMLLLQSEDRVILVDLIQGRIAGQQVERQWSFAAELEGGPVGEILGKVSKLRAFLPIADVEVRKDQGLVLDDEQKTRARFHSIVLFGKKKTISFGSTQYLRGYQQAHSDLVGGVAKLGGDKGSDIARLYKRLGCRKIIYTPKPELSLDPAGSAKHTAVMIIRTFIKTARLNESGVIDDYDSEFLHDYRVSFRKVRSVLSLFKNVFDKELTLQLKNEFADLMRDTNRLRDLDVYLLERDTYFQLVPETSHEGLAILFSYLNEERRKEFKKVKKTLRSSAYKEKVKILQEKFEKEQQLKSGTKGDEVAIDFGSRLILKRYAQVCRIAGQIDADTEDEVVHELRINCKKLRYLMEFFTPLYEVKKIKSLIKALKVLQDNLGKFNDFSVQQGFLRHIVENSLSSFNEDEIKVTESIGALTAMLHRLQLKERKQVIKNFARFDSEETRGLFKELFEGGVN